MPKQLRDPGPVIVDKILNDLEELRWKPAEVARKARFLRSHIDGLRARLAAVEAVQHVAPATPPPWGNDLTPLIPAGDARVKLGDRPSVIPLRVLAEENFQLARQCVNAVFEGRT